MMNLFQGGVMRDADDELSWMLEDHKVESISFVRDDSGTWFGRINTDLGYCSAAHWREVTPEAQEVLDREHERTRDRD